MKFIHTYDEIENSTICELVEKIKKSEKITIKEIKLIDLIYDNRSLNGIYIFFNKNDEAKYIGKTGSRALLERIAGHFDLRPTSYMNTFLYSLSGRKKGHKEQLATLEELQKSYTSSQDYKLVFIEIQNHEILKKLEIILIKEFNTEFNRSKSKLVYLKDKIITEI